jgi:hypothetical protein
LRGPLVAPLTRLVVPHEVPNQRELVEDVAAYTVHQMTPFPILRCGVVDDARRKER